MRPPKPHCPASGRGMPQSCNCIFLILVDCRKSLTLSKVDSVNIIPFGGCLSVISSYCRDMPLACETTGSCDRWQNRSHMPKACPYRLGRYRVRMPHRWLLIPHLCVDQCGVVFTDPRRARNRRPNRRSRAAGRRHRELPVRRHRCRRPGLRHPWLRHLF